MAPAPAEHRSRTAAMVVVAAGRSERMGEQGVRKPLLELGGVALVVHSLRAMQAAELVDELVLVAHPDDVERVRELVAAEPLTKLAAVVPGGSDRSASVRAGVDACSADAAVIGIHDAARPFVRPADVDACVRAAHEHGAALLAVPVRDTLHRAGDDGRARETVEREGLWAAQTPQCFAAGRMRALVAAHPDSTTDDAGLWQRHEGPVVLVEGDPRNAKITTSADLELARALLARTP